MNEYEVMFEGSLQVGAEDEDNLRQLVQDRVGHTGVIVMEILDVLRLGDSK